MVAQMCLNVTLYIHCLSFFNVPVVGVLDFIVNQLVFVHMCASFLFCKRNVFVDICWVAKDQLKIN